MKIACSIITKDDSEFAGLEKACASVYDFVDKLFITTNGSGSKKMIEKLAKENKKIVTNHIKWEDDFSKVRNFAFEEIKKENFDFILWIDSDDIFIGGEKLRDIAEKAKLNNKASVFFTYWYGCTFDGERVPKNLKSVDIIQQRERLINPNTMHWKGMLHETPIFKEGSKHMLEEYKQGVNEIVVMHTASLDSALVKMDRNKRILEKQLKSEGDNKDPQNST